MTRDAAEAPGPEITVWSTAVGPGVTSESLSSCPSCRLVSGVIVVGSLACSGYCIFIFITTSPQGQEPEENRDDRDQDRDQDGDDNGEYHEATTMMPSKIATTRTATTTMARRQRRQRTQANARTSATTTATDDDFCSSNESNDSDRDAVTDKMHLL